MTRKDWKRIALVMAKTEPLDDTPAHVDWKITVDLLADMFALYYPNFNRDKFVQACQFDYYREKGHVKVSES